MGTDDPAPIKAVQAKLDAAVREMVQVCKENGQPLINEEHIVSGYALVIEGTGWDEQGNSATSGGYCYDGGDMPTPHAIGLLITASDYLRGIGNSDG